MKNLISLFIIVFVLFTFSQCQCEVRAQAELGYSLSKLEAEADVQVYLDEKIEIFIDSVTWCFFNTSCNNQDNVDAIGIIIKKYGWSADDYGIACVPLYDDDGSIYLHLRIVMVSKINPDKRYLHIWELEQEEDAPGI